MVFSILLLVGGIINVVGGFAMLLTGPATDFALEVAGNYLIMGIIAIWVALIMRKMFIRMENLEKDMARVYDAVRGSYADFVTHAYHAQNRVIDRQRDELSAMRKRRPSKPKRPALPRDDEEEDE